MLEMAVPLGADAQDADVLVVRVDGNDVEEILALLAGDAASSEPVRKLLLFM